MVVVCSFTHDRWIQRAVEHDKGKHRQVDVMDLVEDLLPHTWVCCRLFLCVQGIQGRVAVEVQVASLGWGRLVALEQYGIIGVIAPAHRKLGDVIPACDGSCGR